MDLVASTPLVHRSSNRRSLHKTVLRPPVSFDSFLLSLVVLLVSFSLVILYSTTGVIALEKYGDSLFYVRRQASAAVLGFFALFVCYKLSIAKLRKLSPYMFFLAVLLLVLPLLPGLGAKAGGAQRWISLVGLGLQPGELAKLAFVLFIAGYFGRHEDTIRSFSSGLLKPLLYAGVLGILYLAQPDFGSTAIIAVVTLSMSMATGARIRHLLLCGVIVAVLFSILVMVSPYRMARVLSFLAPTADSAGKGYQLVQSLIALGSGELFGVGLGLSQQKLFFLPAAHTDFIFAVIGEELGFIGCLICMTTYIFILWRGMQISRRNLNDSFLFALSVGLTMLIVVPAFLNFGVVTGLLPTKGLVLPLIGYGGSSLLSNLMTIGILLNIGKNADELRRAKLPRPRIRRA